MWASAVLACLILLPVLAPSVSYVWGQWGRPPDPRFGVYKSVGLYLRQHAVPEATVASVEVGILGYFSGLHVLDLTGLVTPGVVEARSQGRLAQFVAAANPDYILDVPRFRVNVLALLRDVVAQGNYRLAQEFLPDHPGGAYRLLERAPQP